MKRLAVFILTLLLFLSGCTTYQFQKGKRPYDKGYVVTRYGTVIPEYTLGENNSVPDEKIAQERFKRRRPTVEGYYKKMGQMGNRFKQMFIDPPVMGFKFIVGIFRTPFRLADDYQYNHDPKYREQVEKQEDKEYQAERERLKDLKEKLKAYIDEDLKKESPGPKKPLIEEPKFPQGESTLPQEQAVGATTPAVTAAIVEKPAEVKPLIEARPDEVKAQPEIKLTETTALPVEEPAIVIPVVTPASVEEKPVEVETQPVEKLAEAKPSLEVEPAETKPQVEVNKEVSKPEDKPAEVILPPQAVEEPVKPKEEPIVAAPIPQTPKPEISYPNPQPVIIAKPVKGPSPLKVNFYGYKSTSPNGKVVSYLWDFGDGDTSTKKNPTNTYWSATYGARSFTVSLTVKDDKGATATSRIVIEVGNK